MKANSIWIAAAVFGGILALPVDAVAQGGPPVWVQERILGQGQRGGEGVARGRRGQVLERAGTERINGCAPGLEVARRTPAGPILAAIFGAGGPASHARPGCRGDDDRYGIYDDRDRDDARGRGSVSTGRRETTRPRSRRGSR